MLTIVRGGKEEALPRPLEPSPPTRTPGATELAAEDLTAVKDQIRAAMTEDGLCSYREAEAVFSYLCALRGPEHERRAQFDRAAVYCLRQMTPADAAKAIGDALHDTSRVRQGYQGTDDARAAIVTLMTESLAVIPEETQRHLARLIVAIAVGAENRTRQVRTAMGRLMGLTLSPDDLAHIIGTAVRLLRRQPISEPAPETPQDGAN